MKISHSSAEQRIKRLTIYSAVANQLATLSDRRLAEILAETTPINSSMGDVTSILTLNGTSVFIKKIRLTDIEQQPENIMSTANLFELPLYYQYGISSAGFGAWRELSANIMTTNWVLADKCPHFPLMYHWRLLPSSKPNAPKPDALKEIERSVKYWDGSPAIRARLEAKQKASADIILFLEYIPDTLNQWFSIQIKKDDQTIQSTINMVKHDLITVTSFMKSQGLLHFDAHFENILTDGNHLYFTDFGLAISSQFELSNTEAAFFEIHRDYDLCLVIASFVNRILAATFESKKRNSILQEYANSNYTTTLSPVIAPIIKCYAPIAALMKNFNQQLVTEAKTIPYPAAKLAQACIAADILSK